MDNGQKGFTLIELLVVIGILASLAAVAIPTYSRFFGQGEQEANASELSLVQNAMDSMMADNLLESVNAQVTGTNYFYGLPTGHNSEYLFPHFLRSHGEAGNPTMCIYTWTTRGRMTQVSCQ